MTSRDKRTGIAAVIRALVTPEDFESAIAEANTRVKQIFDKWRGKKMVAGGGKDK